MTFAHPQLLILLTLIPAFLFFVAWANKQRKAQLEKLGDRRLIDRLSDTVNWTGRRWKIALWFVALTLIVIAAARPQWGTEVQAVDQEGLQVMVALDVSNSMLAADIKPTRLDRAKLEISDLMNKLNGDEIGLVLFSGASFIQFPLTSDYTTARNYVQSADPSVISRSGTVIGDAIYTAMQGFDPNLESQKVLIIMTDGEDSETDAVAAAQAAADAGVMIYTIGFGTAAGEPIPDFNQYDEQIGFKTDQAGNVVLSKLDEATLQQIAQTGNGRYFQATAAGSELDQLLNEIDDLQKATLESRFETRRIERYQIFLAIGLLALVLAEFIPERKVKLASKDWRFEINKQKSQSSNKTRLQEQQSPIS